MNQKLSLRQVFFLYLLITISPAIRDIPNAAARAAHSASWLSPLISLVFLIGMVFLVNALIKKKDGSFYDLLLEVCGKPLAKLVILLYFIWSFTTAAVSIQYYAGRFQSTIMPYTQTGFFVGIMLILVLCALYAGIKTMGRLSEMVFPVILLMLGVLFVLALPVIRGQHLLPVSSKDFVPVARASGHTTVIGSYLIAVVFFMDRMKDKEMFWKQGLKNVCYFTIAAMLILIVCIGVSGANVTGRLPFPFFTTIKQIAAFGVIERLEPLLISVWMISDFVMVAIFTGLAFSCLKWLLNAPRIRVLFVPVLICLYFYTMLLANTQFELDRFFRQVMMPVNLIFQYLIPLLLLAVGRVRKKL